MKNRKYLAIILSAVLIVSLLTGCAKSMDAGMAEDYYYNAPESAGSGVYDDSYKEVGEASIAEAELTDRKLIKTVELDAETEDLDELLGTLTQQVNQLGGYVENQRVYNGSAYSKYRSRSASMTIRIPAEKLDAFVNHVEGSTNIVSRYSYIDDVTLTYVATESRVNALVAEEQRLLELLGQAETMSDLLEVEARLTDVRYELESVTSRLNVLKNQVSYSTVNLSIDEVVEYTPVEEETFWQRISGGFMDSLKGIGDGVVEVTVFVLANLPYLVLLAVCAVAVIFLAKRTIRRKKAKKAENNEA
jgi:hypothetical protein